MMTKERLLEALGKGLKAANLDLGEPIQQSLIRYIERLIQWNARHNLTAVRDPLDMVYKHLLDSLTLMPFLSNGRVLDVGTGAGLPGIPLALARPEQTFVLLDSNQKKILFVENVILSLPVRNATVALFRAEEYRPPELFQWVISRAFGSLETFVRLCGHLCHPEGSLVAMKGVMTPEELAALPAEYVIDRIEPVHIPGLEASRTLVFIKHARRALSD